MDKKALLEHFKGEVDAVGTSLTHILKMCEFDEDSNDFESDTVHDYSVGCLNGAWWMYQREQAKVEELHKQKSLQEMEINHLGQANQQYKDDRQRKRKTIIDQRKEIMELQKRVDAATRKWLAVTSIATTCPNNLPDEFFQKLDELHDALCGVGLEQALKGESCQ